MSLGTDMLSPWSLEVKHVIDIGCADGAWSKAAMLRFPSAKVTGIDAREVTVPPILRCSNRFSLMTKTCLGREASEEPFWLFQNRNSSSLLPREKEVPDAWKRAMDHPDAIARKVVTADSLGLDVPEKTLIKMDVQGNEADVIRGGKDLFRRAHLVVTEVILVPAYKGQATFLELVAQLDKLGYRYRGNIRQARDKGKVIVIDALFERES